jgi:hypothetical protein
MSDTITVYRERWDALEALAQAVGEFAVGMPADPANGYHLLPTEARAVYAAWRATLRAPHVQPQPRLFAEDAA